MSLPVRNFQKINEASGQKTDIVVLDVNEEAFSAFATQYGLIAASITAISGSCDWMRLFNCFAQELPTDRGALQGRRDTEKPGAMAGL